MTQSFRAIPAYRKGQPIGLLLDGIRNIRHPWDLVARMGRDVGPLCRVLSQAVVLNDPDAIREVLIERPEDFPKGPPGPALFPVATNASMFVQPGGEKWRRAHDANPMLPAMKDGWLEEIVPDIEEVVSEQVDRWVAATPREPLVNTFDSLRHLAFDVLSRNLFGETFSDTVYRRFVRVAGCLDRRVKAGPLAALPVAPWYRPAIRRLADEFTRTIADRRRAGPVNGSDLLSRTIRENSSTPPQVLASQFSNLFFASAFSMSTAIAGTLFELGRHPEELERVQAAVDELLAEGPLTYAGLLECEPLQNAIREAMRLKPPVAVFMREVTRDRPVTIRDYEIPPGKTVVISCKHLHVAAEHWEAPKHYRPDRWANGGSEANDYGSAYYFPFGRGLRACYGTDYGVLYISVAVALMLGRSRPEVGRDQTWSEGFWFGCMFPRKLRSRFHPR